jgi:TIR domain
MRIFASYSRKDAAEFGVLVADLEQAHISVWHDLELRGGEPWWQDILVGIRNSDVFVFALSNNSVHSKPCLSEFAYARALGLPVVPVQIGPVDHIRTSPVASIQVIDYRERTVVSGLKLVAAIQDAAAQRRPLPDPLPPQPPVPFEYLLRLGSAIGAAHLTPDEQADFIHRLRECLETEEDENVRGDASDLLRALRRRPDVTYRNAEDIDQLLTELASSPETSDVRAAGVARHRATAGAGDSHPGNQPRRRATVALLVALLAALLATLAVVAVVWTRSSNPTGVFAGRAGTPGIGVAVMVDDGKATAYVCDGQNFDAWLQGTIDGARVRMTGENGSFLSGTYNDHSLTGVITTPHMRIPFLAGATNPPAGVYQAEIEVEGGDTYVSWAVVSTDAQFGVTATGDSRQPAPVLDARTGNFTLDGKPEHAKLVKGGDRLDHP